MTAVQVWPPAGFGGEPPTLPTVLLRRHDDRLVSPIVVLVPPFDIETNVLDLVDDRFQTDRGAHVFGMLTLLALQNWARAFPGGRLPPVVMPFAVGGEIGLGFADGTIPSRWSLYWHGQVFSTACGRGLVPIDRPGRDLLRDELRAFVHRHGEEHRP